MCLLWFVSWKWWEAVGSWDGTREGIGYAHPVSVPSSSLCSLLL